MTYVAYMHGCHISCYYAPTSKLKHKQLKFIILQRK